MFLLSANVCHGATFLTWMGGYEKETESFSWQLWYGCYSKILKDKLLVGNSAITGVHE